MLIPDKASAKMEYIQKVFLGVQDYMQKEHELEEVIAFLDSEPPEFRSVAFESASMEVCLKDLADGQPLNNWIKFYNLSREAHSFHIEIGLGWAFAKTEISPESYWPSLDPIMHWMVYDGMGYYCGLFKRRRTIKDHLVPEGIDALNLHGFDQGLGRRLWYDCKGNVQKIVPLIASFASSRHADLWRGVGIACAYVGGTDTADLASLSIAAAEHSKQLRTGIVFAAMSRDASGSVTKSMDVACQVICGLPIRDVLLGKADLLKQTDYLARTIESNWIA